MVENEPGPIDPDACYLHAAAKKEIVVQGQEVNVMASVTGAGHYVGNFLFVQQDHDAHFFLEADDIVYVDGHPATNGTGLEDCYNGGHYYNWVSDPIEEPEGQYPPFAIRPLHGILRVARTALPPLGRADQYRWMIADRVSFTESLEVQIETSYSWAGSQWISVVFWYQVPAVVTGAPDRSDASNRFGLELPQNAPNPVTAATTIRFTLPVAGPATLEVYDVTGRRVETLIDRVLAAGPHEIRWDPAEFGSGVYFCRLRAGERERTRKLVLVRD
jgi:hypothetical protein